MIRTSTTTIRNRIPIRRKTTPTSIMTIRNPLLCETTASTRAMRCMQDTAGMAATITTA
ncbi:hypothetical protein [Chitinophaga rhizosphaerae]|uniref:hypothetical protein n=1 Tax=Chitinophaga rhizosphaerae TaxID=1864947 RepID=UPI00196BB221|nr:hypothetical protein [Chitinophaga rhizosphaerae]